MKIFLILIVLIKLVSSVQYNQPCTFSSGTCNWNIGRRWHMLTFDNGNKVLIADAESKEDKHAGFTDAIMSSWLRLSPLCSFDIRLTFRYNIQNEEDFIEIYLIQKNPTRMNSLGQWKGIIKNQNYSSEYNQSIWQQGNVTFKAAEEFRIDIEIRHVPDKTNDSIVWFGIDDILIENCPSAIVNTTSTTKIMLIPSTIRFYSNESNSTLFNISSWKLNTIPDEFPLSFLRQNLLSLILYLLCALIALTLLIILLGIIIFTYRKYCFSSPIIDQHYRLNKNRVGIQIEHVDHDNQNMKTIDTPIRSCFE